MHFSVTVRAQRHRVLNRVCAAPGEPVDMVTFEIGLAIAVPERRLFVSTDRKFRSRIASRTRAPQHRERIRLFENFLQRAFYSLLWLGAVTRR